MHTEGTYIVEESQEGMRLDRLLGVYIADSSLRLRRRLCDEGRVLVNGAVKRPGFKVRTGSEVTIMQTVTQVDSERLGIHLVHQDEAFAALFKPERVHSAVIAGKDSVSVEALLEDLFPDTEAVLLNRLDYLTSGLLLVALSPDSVSSYHDLEHRAQVRKFYLAEVEGRFDGSLTIDKELDTDNRKKTRVLDSTHPFHQTIVDVVSHDNDRETTFVRCLIQMGARHQIRAHLASIDHPIVGDPLYGNGGEMDRLHLHHERIEFESFSATTNPDLCEFM